LDSPYRSEIAFLGEYDYSVKAHFLIKKFIENQLFHEIVRQADKHTFFFTSKRETTLFKFL